MRAEIEVEIVQLGARGDGIAMLDTGERIYVPYTVPGDIVRAALGEKRPDGFAARSLELLGEGPGRASPPCRHFGSCGGCALQHLDPAHYAAWKTSLLENALSRRGIAGVDILPLLSTKPASRRRADFSARRRKTDLVIGFNARPSHHIVDLAECPVLLPEIAGLVAPLRALLTALLVPAESADVIATRTDSGLDLVLETAAALPLRKREWLAAFAETQDLARLSRRHPRGRGTELVVERRPVRMMFGPVAAEIPPGAFIQPSAEGERALRAAVERGLGGSRRIADLYAGCGTFGLSLAAAGHAVHAVEGDATLAAALEQTARQQASRWSLTVERRDLARRPLPPAELERFDAVVLDPPRAGAAAQAEELARSRVGRVVAVSCNPASFARDARLLLDGGYALDWVQPVDQFLWSPHLELAAAFQRR